MKNLTKNQSKNLHLFSFDGNFSKWTFCLILVLLFIVNDLFSQSHGYVASYSPFANYTYSKDNSSPNPIYSYGNTDKVGHLTYSLSKFYLYRIALQFKLLNLQSIFTIDRCEISFSSGLECGIQDGTIRFTKMPSTWPSYYYDSKKQFNAIGSSTLIMSKSISSETTYYAELESLVSDIQTAIQTSSPYIAVGAYNQYEGAKFGTNFKNVVLRVYYSKPNPPKPTNPHIISKTSGSCVFGWDAPSGNVTGYKVYKNGDYYGTTSSTSLGICNLIPNNTINLSVVAFYNSYDSEPSTLITCTTDRSDISGPKVLCTNGDYAISNVPAGATITWTPSSNVNMVSGQGSNPCTFELLSNGNGTISASISSDCENYVLTYAVHTGPFSSSDYVISGPTSAPCQSYVYYSIPQLEGVESINWIWPSNFTYVSGQGQQYLTLISGDYGGMVSAGVNNQCGQSGSYSTLYTNVSGFCNYALMISPNPASDVVNLSIVEPQSQMSLNSPTSFNVSIIDQSGFQHYNAKQGSKTSSISVQNLKNGTYIIIVNYGSIRISGNLIVNH
jgi:hypothetical protein